MVRREEEASSMALIFYPNTDRVWVEARIEDLERRMGRISRNLNRDIICDHGSTKTKSPFSSRITRFSILRKFKLPHLDSDNGSGSLVDHV